MGTLYITKEVTAKTQALGAQTIDTSESYLPTQGEVQAVALRNWQIQIVPSATPAAGTMTIAVKTPGSTAFSTLATTIDMTGTNLTATFSALVESIKLTPAGFDAAKTYDAYLAVS